MIARDIIEALKREAHFVVPVLFATLSVALPASAQSPLSLSEAIARAKARNPEVGAAAAADREAAERVTQVRGGGQRIFVVRREDYVYLVPFVEDEHTVFLKTIIPSRKATKQYLGEESDDET